jgi:arginase
MLRLISVPYHLGKKGVGMGGGPDRIVAAGAQDHLGGTDSTVGVVQIERPGPCEHETGASFDVLRALADGVRNTVADGDFPFVVGGNCSCVLGVMAGLGLGDRSGVVWFDAHADANTPDTTTSGFLDGMPVAILTGRCWTNLAATIPEFTPLPDDQVVLAAARAIDPAERDLLADSRITVIGPEQLTSGDGAFSAAVEELARRVDSVHVHVDLDAIDVADGTANEFAAPGGPSLDALTTAIGEIAAFCPVNSVSLTSYNPAADHDGRALLAGQRVLHALGSLTTPRP